MNGVVELLAARRRRAISSSVFTGPKLWRRSASSPRALSAANVDTRSSISRSNASPSSSSSRARGRPQSSGAPAPSGGGGWNGDVSLNISPIPPSGVQFASPIRPPGRVTRASSAAAASWSGANMTPNVELTTSKLASSIPRGSRRRRRGSRCRGRARPPGASRSRSAPGRSRRRRHRRPPRAASSAQLAGPARDVEPPLSLGRRRPRRRRLRGRPRSSRRPSRTAHSPRRTLCRSFSS